VLAEVDEAPHQANAKGVNVNGSNSTGEDKLTTVRSPSIPTHRKLCRLVAQNYDDQRRLLADNHRRKRIDIFFQQSV